jgi:predicted PurR-regulated permease PerM
MSGDGDTENAVTSRNPTSRSGPAPFSLREQRVALPPNPVRVVIAAAVALFLVLTFERLIWVIAYPLALIFGGVVIAQGIAPLVEWPARYVPRSVAVVGVYLALLAATGVGAWMFVPIVIAQATALAADLPRFEAALQRVVDRWSPVGMERIVSSVGGYAGQFSGMLLELPLTLVAAGANLVLVFFLSLYWLIAQPRLRGWALSLVPDEHRDTIRDVLGEVGSTVGGYVRGVLISALAVGALTYAGLLLLGMPSAVALAVLAGVGELIPVLGPFLAGIPAVAVALATGAVDPLLVVAFYVGLQQVESNILIPLVMRGQAQIPPLLSLMAFLIGAAVGGVVGALIAIPLFGALRVVVVRMLVPAQRELAGISPAEAEAVRREELGDGRPQDAPGAPQPPAGGA